MIRHCNSILVVEDDQSIRDSVVQILSLEGYSPEAAANGKEALEKLHHLHKPCLILLDLMMPVMDGYAFLSQIGKDIDLAHVVIMTAMTHVNIENIRILKKPFCVLNLLELAEGCPKAPLPAA